MNRNDSAALDRHITGDYGEDDPALQVRGPSDNWTDSKRDLPQEVWLTRCRNYFIAAVGMNVANAATLALTCWAQTAEWTTPEEAAEDELAEWADNEGASPD